MRLAHTFIWTTEVLFEEVSPVTAPAFLKQPDPAFANVETEDAEVPMQLRMSVEAPACIVFVVDVGMSKLPMTARDRFGKRIEQAYKEITQRHLEFELTKTVQDVHDRRRDFKDDHVVTWFSLTDEQDPFGNHIVRKDERTEGENLLEVIGLVIEPPGRSKQRRKDSPKFGDELPKSVEAGFACSTMETTFDLR